MNVWRSITAGFGKVAGLVLPIFAGARDFTRLSPTARLVVRVVALIVVLAILGAINYKYRSQLEPLLDPPSSLRALAVAWLPLLFLFAYCFCWLAVWLWNQLGSEGGAVSFPDIDRAWREAVQALDRAGISLSELPMFLVLGRPQGPETAFFDGAELLLKVRAQPDRDDAPVRVYANREAIYITCAEASVLGRQGAILGTSEFEAPVTARATDPNQTGLGMETNYEMMAFGSADAGSGEEQAIMARAQMAGRGPENLLTEELHALGRLAVNKGDARSGPSRPTSLRDSAEVSLQELRLRHLGRLIARDRQPFCPINGILLLVPIQATNSEQSASLAGQICRRDLESVRQSMQIRCPIFALVCDLEDLPGFRELIRRLPAEQKRRRMGQRFPLIPDVDRSAIPNLMDGAVRWIVQKLLPAQVTLLWQVEASPGQSGAEELSGNIRLFQLLQQARERHSRLARILSHAILADGDQPAMLGGCYLAATGPNPRTDQAFIPGVFRRLIETQDLVSWTPEVLEAESRYRRWAAVGFAALGSAVGLSILLIGYLVVRG